jgi:hypothetical protein
VVCLTAEGEAAARLFRTRKKDRTHRIPKEQIDAAGRAIRPTRTYAFESYTTEDLDQIRDLLDEQYQDVSDESLKHQLANRRKVGAFSNKGTDDDWPDWYKHYRTLLAWKDAAEQAIDRAQGRCSVNWDHDGEGSEGPIDAYQRRITSHGVCVLGSEEPKDLIVLCRKCRKRLRASLAVPPTDNPGW